MKNQQTKSHQIEERQDKNLQENRRKKKKKRILIPAMIIAALAAVWIIYVSDYYHAEEWALACLAGGDGVTVEEMPEGFLLDGPGEENALIFYPGGKVEYTAYLPLLTKVSKSGTDCFLVKMPSNLAIFGKNKAAGIMRRYGYSGWYIGGHSLGGVAAAMYAAGHDMQGLILLAAYPTKAVDERALTLYGSNDCVLDKGKTERAGRYLPEGSVTEVIEGGNHAQFGSYGPQKGDGEASISAEEQQNLTAQKIREFIEK